MIAKWIDIDGGRWRIVVNYDVTPDESIWVEKQLHSVNARESDIDDALRLFYEPNKACTVSDPDERMSVVCIGWTTSRTQWHNSIVHEIDHVQRDICEYYDVSLGGELAAYLQGYLASEMIL
jgi:hypothetical protein